MAAIAIALTLLGQPTHTQNTQDPFVRCAIKVVRGDYGKVPEWKLRAYQRGLLNNVMVAGHCWRTSYYPWEGRSGRVDSRGNPCTHRTAAANKIPRGTYVWIENPCEMRQVLDRGSKRNDQVARHKGAGCWIDTWEDHFTENTLCHYAVIGGE